MHPWFLIPHLYKKYKFWNKSYQRNKSYQICNLLWLINTCSDELKVDTVQMCFCEGLISYSSDIFFKVKFWQTRQGWPLEGQTRPHLNVLQHHYTVGCEYISNNAAVLGVMFYSTPSWKEKTLDEKKNIFVEGRDRGSRREEEEEESAEIGLFLTAESSLKKLRLHSFNVQYISLGQPVCWIKSFCSQPQTELFYILLFTLCSVLLHISRFGFIVRGQVAEQNLKSKVFALLPNSHCLETDLYKNLWTTHV